MLILLGGVTIVLKRKVQKKTDDSTPFPSREGYGKTELDTSLDHAKYELEGAGHDLSQLDAAEQ